MTFDSSRHSEGSSDVLSSRGALLAGSALALLALRRAGPLGLAVAAAGGIWAWKRWCSETDTTPGARLPGRWLTIERTISIARPRQQVFAFWRDPTHFPQFMSHVESVTAIGPDRHRWVVRGPLRTSLQWESDLYDIEDGRRIRWRAVPPADIRNEGTVTFEDEPGETTLVRLHLAYFAPGGELGAKVARMLGEEPDVQAADDLERLKRLLESQPQTGAAGGPLG